MIALKVEKIFKVAPNGKIYEEIRNPVGMGQIFYAAPGPLELS